MLTFPSHIGAPLWVKGLWKGKTNTDHSSQFDRKVSTILLDRRLGMHPKLHRINRVVKINGQGAREDSGSVSSTNMVAHDRL